MPVEDFDLRLVTPFAIVAEELHFGRAAERLGIAQPALSQQIARLERQLGTRLLDRDGRRIGLTPAGARFLVEGREIVARANLVEAALRAGAEGHLRVHLGDGDHPLIGRILSSFLAAHPGTQVDMARGAATDASRALVAGDAEVGFDLPGGTPPGFAYAALDRRPIGVLTPVDHPVAQAPTARWTALEGERIYLAPPGVAEAYNARVRLLVGRAGVEVVEHVGPRVSRAYFLLPAIEGGEAVLLSVGWSFPVPPPRLAWTELVPNQDLELGVMWNEAAASATARRFVAWAKGLSVVDTLTDPGTSGTEEG